MLTETIMYSGSLYLPSRSFDNGRSEADRRIYTMDRGSSCQRNAVAALYAVHGWYFISRNRREAETGRLEP
jgi:hypothetical protein